MLDQAAALFDGQRNWVCPATVPSNRNAHLWMSDFEEEEDEVLIWSWLKTGCVSSG